MAASTRGGIHAVIPWIALVVVTLFAFNQLSQRNRALRRAVNAEEAARRVEQGAPVPPAQAAPPAITARERKLDEALLAAQEVTRGDTRRIATLQNERDRERGRADRASATRATESARANALAVRATIAEVEGGKAAAARAQLEAQVDAERRKHLEDLTSIQAEITGLQSAAARIQEEKVREIEALAGKLRAEQEEHVTDVMQLQQALQDTQDRANQLAVERVTAESKLAQVAEKGALLEKQLADEQRRHTEDVTQLQQSLNDAHERANRYAVLKTNAENALALKQAALVKERDAARNAAKTVQEDAAALRKRLVDVTTVQLASEDPSYLVTGARVVGLLQMRGFAARLLELTDHDDTLVRAAAARGLARAGDLTQVPLEAGDAALALMADDSIRVRMAGKDLLAAATGKKIDFDPGAPAEKRAAALKELQRRLGS